jgi:UDP-glucose 4-epimerase
MRAVVTGGAGFIGSNLVDRLVETGADVLVVDDLSTGSRANLERAQSAGARLVELDVRDRARLRNAMAAFAPDTVFHLAAQIDVRASMADPARDAEINVVGSVHVFASALEAGARRVINTSTGGAIYGTTESIPTAETEPARPLSGYGLSKRTAEQYGAWFRSAHGLDVVTLRYGNVYGPRQDPTGDAGVVARFCDRVLAKEPPLVFGDGTQTRDYVHVGDIVAANIAAATSPRLPHDIYNVGTGTEVSVLELIAAVARAAGSTPESFAPQFHPARAGEVLRSCLDVSRARTELSLPEPTPLEVGLADTLAWIRSLRVP